MITRRALSVGMVVLAGIAVPTLAQSPSIKSIEVNQAIGVQKNNNLKFVAGKMTVIRAIMTSAVTVDPSHTSATITRDGKLVATLTPDHAGSATTVVDFQCPSRITCGNWAAGSYVFDVRVNGETSSTAGTTYRFIERQGLRALALPVKANYAGTVVAVSGDGWKSMWEFTRNVYPVAADKFTWTIREELDASDRSFDLETDAGQLKLWEALAKLMPPHCLANKAGDGCFDKIIGFIQARPKGYPNGTLQGYTYGNPANIVVASDEDAPATVAHEIAHTLEIGDAYDGGSFNCTANPVPDLFNGKDFNDSSKPAKCTAGRVALPGVSGTLIPAAHHPYEVGGRGLLGDTAEYMGSGGRQAQFWTTQDAYDWIFDKLAPSAGSGQPASPRFMASAAPTQRLIEFFGIIRQDPRSSADVEVEPWESLLDDDLVPDTTGRLMIAAVSASGARLASQAITVAFDVPGSKGEPPVHHDPAPFAGIMRFPAGTTKFQILNGTTIVREVAVSPNAPVVSAITMNGGSVFTGVTSIRWTGADADGDTLYYSIEYNPDVTDPHSDFEPLGTFFTTPQWTEDFSKAPGGDHAKLRIIATDGINGSYADTPEFRVPFKAPSVDIRVLPQTSMGELTLSAVVEDLQDGELPDEGILWLSKRLGVLGTGAVVIAKDLPAGPDEFTVVATNSGGVRTSKTIAVTVINTRVR